jgi:hypothetical protein
MADDDIRVELSPQQVMQVFDALSHSRRHLQRRDEMNAEIHLGEVRWSPLAELVASAETMLQDTLQDQAIIGAPIQHVAHIHPGEG